MQNIKYLSELLSYVSYRWLTCKDPSYVDVLSFSSNRYSTWE